MVAHILDIGAYVFSLSLIAVYYLFLYSRLRRDRTYTIQSVISDARAAWVENIMSDKNNGILAVQTLRNSTMAATFLASTAILLIMGVLNLMQKSSGTDNVLESLQNGFIAGGDVEEMKLLILLVAFFAAFFSFSMAVRMYNHVGYLINSTNSRLQFSPTPAYVSRLLNRSGRYYSFGMRAYYISVPLIFGLFNPYYMCIASIGLILALYRIDRTPDIQASDSDIHKYKRSTEGKFGLKILVGKKQKASAAEEKKIDLESQDEFQANRQAGAAN